MNGQLGCIFTCSSQVRKRGNSLESKVWNSKKWMKFQTWTHCKCVSILMSIIVYSSCKHFFLEHGHFFVLYRGSGLKQVRDQSQCKVNLSPFLNVTGMAFQNPKRVPPKIPRPRGRFSRKQKMWHQWADRWTYCQCHSRARKLTVSGRHRPCLKGGIPPHPHAWNLDMGPRSGTRLFDQAGRNVGKLRGWIVPWALKMLMLHFFWHVFYNGYNEFVFQLQCLWLGHLSCDR